MKFKLILISVFICTIFSFSSLIAQNKSFELVFFTDVHLTNTENARSGFSAAINQINVLKPDFCISGGDNTGVLKGVSIREIDIACALYKTAVKTIESPVYFAHGNHELLAIYNDSVETADYFNEEEYYSFDFKNWHFMVLHAVEPKLEDNSYCGLIDSTQMDWIRKDLSTVDSKTPIVLVSHIPFQTVLRQRYFDAVKAVSPALIVNNNKEVLALFQNKKLKLVLQGHTHIFEDIKVDDVRFITGGAVCGAWWKGPRFDTQEGFLHLKFTKKDFQVSYVDSDWSPLKANL